MNTSTIGRLPEIITEHLTIMKELRAGSGQPASWVYTGPEDFILQHGQFWTPQNLPKGYRAGILKQCFHNSGRLALTRKGVRYVEGYAIRLSLGIPMHHAWVVDAKDRVIDVTWDLPIAAAYFGVAFPTATVRAHQRPEEGSMLYGAIPNLYATPWVEKADR